MRGPARTVRFVRFPLALLSEMNRKGAVKCLLRVFSVQHAFDYCHLDVARPRPSIGAGFLCLNASLLSK